MSLLWRGGREWQKLIVYLRLLPVARPASQPGRENRCVARDPSTTPKDCNDRYLENRKLSTTTTHSVILMTEGVSLSRPMDRLPNELLTAISHELDIRGALSFST